MKPLISIIVPVFNVENYIEFCVKSLCRQTYSNIEIILINDGSTDSSGLICDELKKCDNRIVVIHQSNQGVSAARNTGLRIMKGEYVTFIDSDDYVSPDYIQCLYDALKKYNADISTCAHYRVNFNGEKKKISFFDSYSKGVVCLSGVDSIKNMFFGKICSASSGSKLYNKKLFEDLQFPDFIMGEDTFIVYHCFSKSAVVAHTDLPLYYYVQHKTSVTNSKSNYIKFYDYVKLYDYIMITDKNKSDKDYFDSLANRLIENNFWVYMKLRNCPNQYLCEKKHIEHNIKKYRKYVINNKNAQTRVRLACLLSYGGYPILNLIYDNINKKN